MPRLDDAARRSPDGDDAGERVAVGGLAPLVRKQKSRAERMSEPGGVAAASRFGGQVRGVYPASRDAENGFGDGPDGSYRPALWGAVGG